jgi:hypothetical protein
MRTTIECPTTGALLTINVKDDKSAVGQGWNRSLSVQCPHCNQPHAIRYKDAYMEGVLAGIQGNLDQLLKPPKSSIEGGAHGDQQRQRGRLRSAGVR